MELLWIAGSLAGTAAIALGLWWTRRRRGRRGRPRTESAPREGAGAALAGSSSPDPSTVLPDVGAGELPRLQDLARFLASDPPPQSGGMVRQAHFSWRGFRFGYSQRELGPIRWGVVSSFFTGQHPPVFQVRARMGPQPVPSLGITSPYAVGVRSFDDRFDLVFPHDGERGVRLPLEVWTHFARLDDLARPPSPLLEVRERRALLYFPLGETENRKPEDVFRSACAMLEVLLRAVAPTRSDPGVRILASDSGVGAAPALCQVCGEVVTAERIACTRCRTPHHRDCWDYHGSCSTFGCGCPTYVEGNAEPGEKEGG